MITRKSASLRALALAVACLTAACTTLPLTPQDTRALRTQATDGGDASITVKTLNLSSEDLTLDLEASEAILALTNPTPEGLSVKAIFEGTARADAERHVSSLGGTLLDECGLRPHRRIQPRAFRPGIRAMEAPTAPRTLEATMSFHIDGDEETYPIPQATQLYWGTHCVIYLDDRDADWLTRDAAKELGEIFDSRTYPKLTETFGEELPNPRDGFNFGQDRTIFLFSRELAHGMPGSAGMVTMLDFLHPELVAEYGYNSHYAKMVYMLPSAISPLTPGTMAHEFVHVLFDQQRMKTYGELHGLKEESRFGWDGTYYVDDPTYFAEQGMNEGLAELGEFLSGYSPEEHASNAQWIGRFLGNPQLSDLLEFRGPAGTNYGEMSLFNSYLFGRDPGFTKKFLTATATGSAAIAEAMGTDFPGLFRDFTLALALDGLSPAVPSRYQIPLIDLHKTYDTGSGLLPMRGANDSSAPLVLTAPRPHGVRYTRVRFPNGKGKLTINGDPQLKASLILLNPSRPEGFVED